jgi:hypothetical protein
MQPTTRLIGKIAAQASASKPSGPNTSLPDTAA